MMEVTDAGTPRRYAWYEAWLEVLLHPSERSFVNILADPTASPARAYLWVGVVAMISGVIQFAAQRVAGIDPFADSNLSLVFGLVCGVIGAPIFALIGFAVTTAIYHWLARLLGGQGTYDRLAYAYGAITAPVSVLSTILAAFLTPAYAGGRGAGILGLCLGPISLALGIYAIVLIVLAIKVVEQLTTGKAVLTVLLPTIIILVLVVGCVVLALVPWFIQSSGGFQ